MNIEIKDLIVFDLQGYSLCGWTECFNKNIITVSNFFGFVSLPNDIKLHLHICEKDDFETVKQKTDFAKIDEVIAFTCNTNHIYVMRYEYVKDRFTTSSYAAIIVHECVHVFQFYYTRLPQTQYVWLYESIACYLAGQEKKYDRQKSILWEDFVNDFYHVPNCYGLAYKFGKSLFRKHKNGILKIIKNPEQNYCLLKELFISEIME